MDTVSEKLKHKLSLRPPPKILVEKYLIEISKNYNVPYEPDLQVRPSTDINDIMIIDTYLLCNSINSLKVVIISVWDLKWAFLLIFFIP